MNGGKITKHTASGTTSAGGILAASGGGVGFNAGGEFIMNDGEISDNVCKKIGGGVNFCVGKFTMNGGKITGNRDGTNGGGVYVAATSASATSGTKYIATFAGTAGILSGNLANYDETDGGASVKPSDYYL